MPILRSVHILWFLPVLIISCSQQEVKHNAYTAEAVIPFPAELKDTLPHKHEQYNMLDSDTARLDFLLQLSDSENIYRKSILRYVIAVCEGNNLPNYKILALVKLARDFARRGLSDSAEYYFKKGIDFCTQNKIENREAGLLYRECGSYYTRRTDFAYGFKYYDKAVTITERCGDSDGYMTYLSEMGKVYQSIDQYEKALNCFKKARNYASKTHNYSLHIYALNSLGDLYRIMDNPDSAIAFHEQAIQLHKKFRGQSNEHWAITSLGKIYARKNDFKMAEKCFGVILEDAKAKRMGDLEAQAYYQLAKCDIKRGNINQAAENCLKGYEVSLKFPDLDLRKSLAELLSDIYTQKRQYDKALDYYKIQSAIRDSIDYVDQAKKLAEAEFRQKEEGLIGKIEKNTEQLRLQQEKGRLEAKRQNLIILSVSILFCMALIFAFFIYRSLQRNKKQKEVIADQKKEVEKQKAIIEKKQGEIVSSIQYAKSIQKTMLTNHEFINEHIPENFIFFRPKDIVSGDFYWATRHAEKFYLAVCDSTGHGVPGAFMSLLNIGFLSEAINEKGITDPAAVFNYVRSRLIHSISKENQKDGFDGILACIDSANRKISYVAANNTPVLLRNGSCTQLPYDRMPVGVGPKLENFTTHTIEINTGDIMYLCTDGFEDQFGGPEGKKFRSKNLQELFVQHAHLSLQKQMEHLERTFETWKSHPAKNGTPQVFEQIDDVCVVGIKIN